jgi:hypothetical protein
MQDHPFHLRMLQLSRGGLSQVVPKLDFLCKQQEKEQMRQRGKYGGALSCRVTNRLSRRVGKGIKWLLKAIIMVEDKTTNRKTRHKWVKSSVKLEHKWRG